MSRIFCHVPTAFARDGEPNKQQDHRAIKRRCASMAGFKSFASAAITIVGIELAHRIRKGQFSFGRGRRRRDWSRKDEWVGPRIVEGIAVRPALAWSKYPWMHQNPNAALAEKLRARSLDCAR